MTNNRSKNGRFVVGHIPSDEMKKKMSMTKKERYASGEIVTWNKGKSTNYYSPGRFKKGNVPWDKGKTIDRDDHPNMGHFQKHSQEAKQKMRVMKLGIKLSKEHIRKCLKRKPMSSLEKKTMGIIQKHNLPYKFVGNGEFLVGRKCPDFVNCNGQKIAIEVYYRRHKEQFRNGLSEWKKQRENIFREYGWELLFFNETEVNEENLIKRLGD